MNNIFNIKRFGLILRKDIMEGWKRYLLLFLTMIGITTIVITWQSLLHYNEIIRYPGKTSNLNTNILISLSVIFFASGLLFASTFMNPLNSKLKKISYLAIPSSNLEKYFSRWIIITIVYIILFFISIWIADAIRVAICSACYPDISVTFVDLSKLVFTTDSYNNNDYAFPAEVFIVVTSLYFLLQSFFILGSTFWEKSSFIKTFTAGALIILSYILICRWAILLFYGDFDRFFNVLSSFESIGKEDISERLTTIILSSVISFFTLINWSLSYFRFRESEIIKRL